ncbi:DUF397 domain-containing protein [Nocardia cyriacigeorgica]|uniref:DUF397 domain-containing protein n=1 Tax=Nocardia cyriacigeorgica TaxID=135487 RepID=UPI002453C036|nr:DUF397 domain-containing protein [Nocardia cyriacigeorgica]
MSVDLSGARWFKSSRSEAANACVEIAHLPPANPARPAPRARPDACFTAVVFRLVPEAKSRRRFTR